MGAGQATVSGPTPRSENTTTALIVRASDTTSRPEDTVRQESSRSSP